MNAEESLANGPHHWLAQLAGAWRGLSKTWFEPDSAPVEARIQGSIQLILEGRFAIFLYQGQMPGERDQHGLFTFGFNLTRNRWESNWLDNWHNDTAMMFCTGELTENSLAVVGSYPVAEGPDWGWRTEVVLYSPEHLMITAYNITPEGQSHKAIETELTRVNV